MRRTWFSPSIEELNISETAKPGKGKHNGTDANPGNHYGWGIPTVEDPVDSLS